MPKKSTSYAGIAERGVHFAAKEALKAETRLAGAKAAGATRRRILELEDELRNAEERLDEATLLARFAAHRPEPRPKPRKLGITL